MNVQPFLQWLPRGMALLTILAWGWMFLWQKLALIPFLLLILATGLTLFISRKNEALGGWFFVLVGSLYLVVAMGFQFGALIVGMLPLMLTGVLFLFHYFYGEHQEMQGSDF